MTQRSKKISLSDLPTVIGLDVGDRKTAACVLAGEKKHSFEFATDREALRKALRPWPGVRVVLEAGSQSHWIYWELVDLGFDACVVNPRAIKHITLDHRKTDRRDAEKLAELASLSYVKESILPRIFHRAAQEQADLSIIRARDGVVSMRTQAIQQCRSLVKVFGVTLPESSTKAFARKVLDLVPRTLHPALMPLLELIQTLSDTIRGYEKQLEQIASERYPEAERLRQIPGIGPLTSIAFLLSIGDPARFQDSRSVGSWIGLTPKSQASGDRDPDLPISKMGDPYLRRLLVQCAHSLLSRGKDCDLKRFGQRMLARDDGRGRRRKTIVAMARKLAVLMHTLLISGRAFDPDYQATRSAAA